MQMHGMIGIEGYAFVYNDQLHYVIYVNFQSMHTFTIHLRAVQTSQSIIVAENILKMQTRFEFSYYLYEHHLKINTFP